MKYTIVLFMFLAACGSAYAETRISVPSDPRASYFVLEVSGSENNLCGNEQHGGQFRNEDG